VKQLTDYMMQDIFNIYMIIDQQYILRILPLCNRYNTSNLYHKFNCDGLGKLFPYVDYKFKTIFFTHVVSHPEKKLPFPSNPSINNPYAFLGIQAFS